MGKTRYRAINYKGKRLYVWDLKGKYIRQGNEFVKEGKIPVVDNEELELNKIFLALTKNKPFLKKRVKHIKNIRKKIYYVKVWEITEANDLTILKNHHKRGFRKYHLDHIYSISEGFKNDIPPEAIGNLGNLRFIHYKKNIKKGGDVDDEGREVINEIIKKL